MRVHFYIEANPLRAGMVRNLNQLKHYVYSSYAYYAYGIKTKFTEMLEELNWYIALGPTPKIRQKVYRKLFNEYLQNARKKDLRYSLALYLGEQFWVYEMEKAFKATFYQYRIAHLEKRKAFLLASTHPPPIESPIPI